MILEEEKLQHGHHRQMALTSTINTLETVSVPLASSLVETHKGGGVQNNASDKTEATIQWCCLGQRCPCPCLNVILGKDHPVTASCSVHDAKTAFVFPLVASSHSLTSLSQPFSVFNRHPLLHALQKQEHQSVKDSL